MYRFPFICLSIVCYARKYGVWKSVCSRQGISLHCCFLLNSFLVDFFLYMFYALWVCFFHYPSISFVCSLARSISLRFFFFSRSSWLRSVNSCMWNSKSIYGKNVCSAMREKNPNYRIKMLDLCVCFYLSVVNVWRIRMCNIIASKACAVSNRRSVCRAERAKDFHGFCVYALIMYIYFIVCEQTLALIS